MFFTQMLPMCSEFRILDSQTRKLGLFESILMKFYLQQKLLLICWWYDELFWEDKWKRLSSQSLPKANWKLLGFILFYYFRFTYPYQKHANPMMVRTRLNTKNLFALLKSWSQMFDGKGQICFSSKDFFVFK